MNKPAYPHPVQPILEGQGGNLYLVKVLSLLFMCLLEPRKWFSIYFWFLLMAYFLIGYTELLTNVVSGLVTHYAVVLSLSISLSEGFLTE